MSAVTLSLGVLVFVTIENRQVTDITLQPSASSLVLRALKEPPRAKGQEVVHNGNITFNDVLDIARELRPRSFAATFAGNVKEILGTCRSIGCTVDASAPQDLIEAINGGDLTVPEE